MTFDDDAGIVVVVRSARSCVLLVEDDAAVRSTVRRQLETLGRQVIAVGTGREAVRLVELGTVVDVLLTDLSLPDLDGVGVARAIASLAPKTRIAFMSGHQPDTDLEPTAAPFLLKPFSIAALERALVRAIPRRGYPR